MITITMMVTMIIIIINNTCEEYAGESRGGS